MPSSGVSSRRFVDVMKWRDNFVCPCSPADTGFFQTQIEKQEIKIRELPDDMGYSQQAAPMEHEIDVLEENCQTNEQRLSHLLDSKDILERRHVELIELRHVLRETAEFFEAVIIVAMVLMVGARETG
jgi:V-type ATPase 116kDa subunit family